MTYRRVVVSRFGGPEVLQVVEDELPEPRPGEVRVKVLAAGVAWGDVLKRGGFGMGARPPFTPGYDVVGPVDRLGEGVSGIGAGQQVAALPLFGGYAEFLCVPAATVVPVPPGLDPAEAVCLVMNYVVAHQLLHRAARVRPGERILVHGAAGGVGTALLQLGGLAGLEMYGTASGGKHELVAALGGIPVDYRREDFVARVLALAGGGVDAAFDPVGGSHLRRSYQTLRRGGRVVAYGVHDILTEGKLRSLAGLLASFVLNLVPDGRTVSMYNVTRPKYSKPEWCREDLSWLFGLLAQGRIKPVVAERIPLIKAARAHQLLEQGAVTGKLVLVSA